MAKRVNVQVPDEVEDLFNWIVRYDPRFKGRSEAAVVAHFLAKGINDAYQESLREPDPLDADDFTMAAEAAKNAYNQAG